MDQRQAQANGAAAQSPPARDPCVAPMITNRKAKVMTTSQTQLTASRPKPPGEMASAVATVAGEARRSG